MIKVANRMSVGISLLLIALVGPSAAPLPKGAPDLDARPAPEPITRLDGEELIAINAAIGKFRSVEASYGKKTDLQYYRVGCSQDSRAFYVFFDAKDVPHGTMVSPGVNEYGVDIIIAVAHGTYKVLAVYH